MFTKKLNHLSQISWKKALETSIYTVLALALIGQVFVIDTMVSYINAGFVMLGIVFAIAAIYRLTPINNLLDGKDVTIPADADVIIFHNKLRSTARPHEFSEKNAA